MIGSVPGISDVAKSVVTGNDYCDSRVDEMGNTGCDDIERS